MYCHTTFVDKSILTLFLYITFVDDNILTLLFLSKNLFDDNILTLLFLYKTFVDDNILTLFLYKTCVDDNILTLLFVFVLVTPAQIVTVDETVMKKSVFIKKKANDLVRNFASQFSYIFFF